MIQNELTYDRLRLNLSYNPSTGVFVWRIKRRGTRIGKEVGNKSKFIRINHMPHSKGRLAYLYMTGRWPPSKVIHIDGDETNARYDNLKLAE